VTRHFHEYMRERHGRWRPSAAAQRLGSPALDLEVLVYRDGMRLNQAAEMLRTAGRTTLSDLELIRLLEQIPSRHPLRPRPVESEVVLHHAEGPERADDRVAASDAEALYNRVKKALERAMARLDPEERTIATMHFTDGRSLAEVARMLRLDPRSTSRRVKKLRVRLRSYLEAEGISASTVRGVIEGPGGDSDDT